MSDSKDLHGFKHDIYTVLWSSIRQTARKLSVDLLMNFLNYFNEFVVFFLIQIYLFIYAHFPVPCYIN